MRNLDLSIQFQISFNNIQLITITTSSETLCIDGNAWFTTVPLKPFSDQNCERFLKVSNSDNSCTKNAQKTFLAKSQLKIISFPNYKQWYI